MFGCKDRCLIIAEAGVNHDGELEKALMLCDKAKEAGADVVKFQTWKTENIITKNVEQAEYQVENTGVKESQFDMLKRLELSYEEFGIIKKHCDDIGIAFASTADDLESLDFLINLGIPFIKVSSGDVGNISFLRYIGSKKLPVVLSTGMSTIKDVEVSLNALKQGGAEEIVLLHCTTNYPCLPEEVNLYAMNTLEKEFKYAVGYSDHTLGENVAIAAVALGAKIIEKHFTLDCKMAGPDHAASTDPEGFYRLVQAIRNTEKILGDGIKKMTRSEESISSVVTKRIVASCHISEGEVFSVNNVTVKRNDVGMKAVLWDSVIGKVAEKDYEEDEGILLS